MGEQTTPQIIDQPEQSTLNQPGLKEPESKEQPWKKWFGEKGDEVFDEDTPDIVHIDAHGAQPINLGG